MKKSARILAISLIGAVLLSALTGCSTAADPSEAATTAIDQLITGWQAGNTEAVTAMFTDGVVYNSQGSIDWEGENLANDMIDYMSRFSMERTSEAITNDDGTIGFAVEFAGKHETEYYIWDIEMVDDRIVHIDESWNHDA